MIFTDALQKNPRIRLRQDVTHDCVNQIIPKLLKKATDRLFSKAYVPSSTYFYTFINLYCKNAYISIFRKTETKLAEGMDA